MELAHRIEPARGAVAVFVFAKARDVASAELTRGSWRTFMMPGPYASTRDVARIMANMREILRA